MAYGQERVLVVWTRLLRPDGSTLSLEGMPGMDLSGFAGLTGQVNNHYVRLLAGVVLGSLIGASAQIAVGANSQNPSFAALAIQGAGQNINEAGQQITRKNLNIQPTIEVPPGGRAQHLRDQGSHSSAVDRMTGSLTTPQGPTDEEKHPCQPAADRRRGAAGEIALSLPSDLKQSMEQFGNTSRDARVDAYLLQRGGGRHSHGLSRGPRRLSEVAQSPLAGQRSRARGECAHGMNSAAPILDWLRGLHRGYKFARSADRRLGAVYVPGESGPDDRRHGGHDDAVFRGHRPEGGHPRR